MFILDVPDTLWLNLTNIALGIVTLICLVAVGRVVFQEVMSRVRARVPRYQTDPHAAFVPELGLTMADGGTPVDEDPHTDPPNIQRSEN
jgi:hypothetical protein